MTALLAALFCLGAVAVPNEIVVVGVEPKLGRVGGAVTVKMTRAELHTVELMKAKIYALALPMTPMTARAARWFIEPSAADSRTLALSRDALTRLQSLLESLGLVRVNQTNIVVGRSQRFINETLAAIGCKPDLSRTRGLHLMGSSLCDRSVIVINLTGYFFLKSASDQLASEMESRAEPKLRTIDYRIVARNLSGLSHEWAHTARASATEGFVPADEPAWIREGFAELMAGIAMVHLLGSRFTYIDFHVTRLRKFADWGSFCRQSLSRYRSDAGSLAGCEYYVGPLAVEYLVARMGGLEKLVSLFHGASARSNFKQAFRLTYGIPLDAFERRFDAYVAPIALLPAGP